MKRFGVLDLASEMEGCRFSIGLRNSHDESMRLAMTCGYRVFVCSNMAFSGDLAPVLPNGSCGSSRPKRSGKLKRIEEILLSCEILLRH